MTTVLLFHHVLGLTPGVVGFADDLRRAGHDVHTPDLFDGLLFDSIEAGVAHAQQAGFGALIDKGVAHADGLGDGLVVAGFSLGAMPAQKLAQTRPGVSRAVLYHAAVPADTFETKWPTGVGLQIHIVENDPWAEEDLPAARELAEEAGGELCLYPGTGHLVADSSSPDYEPETAALILERTLSFLAAQ